MTQSSGIAANTALFGTDFVACRTRWRATGETCRLSSGALYCHEEVLGRQPWWQTQLCNTHNNAGRGFNLFFVSAIKILASASFLLYNLFSIWNYTFLHLQTKPAQVQATREFAEPRKLPLAPNDIVTVIDHGWVKSCSIRTKTFSWHNQSLLCLKGEIWFSLSETCIPVVILKSSNAFTFVF